MILVVKRIASLIIKQLRNELSVEESIELEQWANENASNREMLQELTDNELLRQELINYYEAEESKEAIWKKIDDATLETTPVIPMTVHYQKKYRYLAAAVTVGAVLTTIAYFWFQQKPNPAAIPVAQTTTNDVLPGGNKAILKLNDGKTIVLDNAQNGLLAQQGAVQIEKQDGQLTYSSTAATAAVSLNTLATPVGGQFQLRLPDGTRVWLNAASSITYPTAFTGKERKVSIYGEAYFEVAKDAAKPFKVGVLTSEGAIRNGTEVEVLGTHFNINAYNNEALVKTSLLEGKVKIKSDYYNGKQSAILKPGQQAQVEVKGKLKVKDNADMEEAVAWKNGEFLFQSADIGTMMRQVARWYDIEVSYPEGMPADKFSGKIGRNVNLSQLLKILEYSEVKFELKGKVLIVHN
jgi:ferric-dicitrate binding protein FerR (iron transport regulator)